MTDSGRFAARGERPPARGGQRGSVLLVSLLFLVLVSMLAIRAARTSSFEARMAHGVRDLHAAFQAAESGLEAGEGWLDAQTSPPNPEPPSSTCTAPCDAWELFAHGDYPDTATKDAAWWQGNARLGDVTIPGLGSQPHFLIEEQLFAPDSLTVGIGVPPGRTFYRVTARGTGRTDAAEVLLQTSYVRRF